MTQTLRTGKRLAVCALAVVPALLSGCSTFQTVTIQSVPPGAQIAVDGVPRGTAPVKVRLLTDSFLGIGRKPYEVVASKAGYSDQKITLNSESAMYNNPQPFPEPVVITLGGQAAPAPSPAVSAPRRAPVSHSNSEPKKEPKKESWR